MIETEPYKHQLEALLTQVTVELESLGMQISETGDWIATPDAVTAEPDPNDAADNVEDWNERQATLSQLETRYNNLKRALQKIEDGTFGVCEVSGAQIEEDRLNANPAARTCKAHMEDEANLPL
ncbi:MAG: TraR/DksA C4-type zinc finger protein [Patescibacteria group bacterium]